MTPGKKRPFSLVMGVLLVFALTFGAFLPALAQSQAQQCESPYTVVEGDTLQSVAQRCGVTIEQLVQANPNISILVAKQLVIPQVQVGQEASVTQTTGGSQDGQIGQVATRLTLQDADSLGNLLGRYRLTREQVRDFLVENAHLTVHAGQTVTFPRGVTVPLGGQVQTGQAQFGQAQTEQNTPTAQATGTVTVQVTPTVLATPTIQTRPPGSFACQPASVVRGSIYVTQENETLGTLLTILGFDVQAEAGSGARSTQDITSEVVRFVHLNCYLTFASGQTANVPSDSGIIIPQTGGARVNTIPTPLAVEDVPGAAGVYTLGANETLSHVALRYNTSIVRLLELNPQITNRALVFPGQQILVPDRNEGPTGQIP
jgi:LysM repeat protein